MGGIEKMCRLTFHVNGMLKYYKNYSHGPLEMPEVQKCLSRLDGLLSDRKDWKNEVEQAETWDFYEPNNK